MKTPITKAKLISAMEKILQEYKKQTHSTMMDNCSLCRLYRTSQYDCMTSCPMYVFWDLSDNCSHPCMNRRCEPMNCHPFDYEAKNLKISKLNTKLNAVQEFYKEAIKKIKKMSNEEIKADNAFDFLIKLDKKVANKYRLNMPVKIKIK